MNPPPLTLVQEYCSPPPPNPRSGIQEYFRAHSGTVLIPEWLLLRIVKLRMSACSTDTLSNISGTTGMLFFSLLATSSGT